MRKSLTRIPQWSLPIPNQFLKSERVVLIGLGSSLGDRRKNLQKGLLLLAHDPFVDLISVSSVWYTQPIGAAKNAFYNMCVVISTTYDPSSLMDALLKIEKRCDRLRGVHWMDRTLDMDVLLFGDEQLSQVSIVVPHPQLLNRSFVMLPALEIAKDWIHPEKQQSLVELNTHSDLGMWKVGRFSIARKNRMQ